MENDPEEDTKTVKERAKARAAPTKKKKAPAPKKGEPVQKSTKKIVYKKIKVNFWRTRLHDEELGVHQQLKYTAKKSYKKLIEYG